MSSDYVGDAGDSNNPCLSLDQLKSASFLPELALQQKQCAGNCSGHGQCMYLSYQTLSRVSSCSVVDLNCYAECDRVEGYQGMSDCSLSDADLAKRYAFRAQIVDSIMMLTTIEDESADNVVFWINSMNEATSKSEEIAPNAPSSIIQCLLFHEVLQQKVQKVLLQFITAPLIELNHPMHHNRWRH